MISGKEVKKIKMISGLAISVKEIANFLIAAHKAAMKHERDKASRAFHTALKKAVKKSVSENSRKQKK